MFVSLALKSQATKLDKDIHILAGVKKKKVMDISKEAPKPKKILMGNG